MLRERGIRYLGWMASTKDGWESVGHVLKVVGLVIAPLFFYYEYRAKVALDARQRAVEEVKSFRGSREFALLEGYDLGTLDSALVARMAEAGKTSVEERSLCPYHRVLLATSSEAALRSDVLRMVNRTTVVASCANAGVCDKDELCRSLADGVHTYFSDMCTVVADVEALWRRRITDDIRTWLGSCGVPAYQSTFCDEIAGLANKRVRDLIVACRPVAKANAKAKAK